MIFDDRANPKLNWINMRRVRWIIIIKLNHYHLHQKLNKSWVGSIIPFATEVYFLDVPVSHFFIERKVGKLDWKCRLLLFLLSLACQVISCHAFSLHCYHYHLLPSACFTLTTSSTHLYYYSAVFFLSRDESIIITFHIVIISLPVSSSAFIVIVRSNNFGL